MNKKFSTKIAKCLCGGVKLKIKGKLRHVKNCHCSQCMKTHGNYAAYTSGLENNIVFINKKTLKWFKSSNIAKRGFCSKCGASIFYKKYNNKNISISAGLFNNPTKLKTVSNIFTKGKLDFYKLDPNLTKFNRYSK
tara:strand:- start:2785 stop:3192 length:408 start_codon:yes stop_codon:yes gene_type:complete